MGFVSEFPFRPERILDAENPFRAQAEIVVLARAFEFGAAPIGEGGATTTNDSGTGEGTSESGQATTAITDSASFVDLDLQSLNSARVIYYSPDVENGQSLNFSNIPVLGPVRYGGRPVGIQIIVLELDRVSPEMRGLLSSLASLGQSSGALPGGGVAEVLTGLGKSLLESNQDDIIFDYRFVLDRSGAANSYNSAPFEAGRYVLRRLQNRSNSQVWRNLELDHNTGELFVAQNVGSADVVTARRSYTDDTYFTLNIIDHGSSAAESIYVYDSLSELRSAIAASTTVSDTSTIQAIDAQVSAATVNLRGSVTTRNLTEDWESVVRSAERLAFNFAPEESPDITKCVIEQSGLADRTRARYQLALDVGTFKRNWTEAVSGVEAETGFESSEQLRVAQHVGAFFFSVAEHPDTNAVTEGQFTDITEFGKLIDGDPIELFARALAYAEQMAPKTCEELKRLGLATAPPAPGSGL